MDKNAFWCNSSRAIENIIQAAEDNSENAGEEKKISDAKTTLEYTHTQIKRRWV